MVVSLKNHFATEKHDLEWCIKELPNRKKHVEIIIKRIEGLMKLDKDVRILEIGAAQGLSLISLEDLRYECCGIEPWDGALQVSEQLGKRLNRSINIKKGIAEKLPYANEYFDVVIADSVMEHVTNAEDVMKEVFRVLKKRGAFYFSTASAMCPMQGEIRFFPFFSWYPQKIKVKIMNWAVKNKPSLVGYTETPAINWFTPWKTERMLRGAGFKKVYGTWNVLRAEELNNKKVLLKIIRLNIITKIIADIFVPGCLYITVKE